MNNIEPKIKKLQEKYSVSLQTTAFGYEANTLLLECNAHIEHLDNLRTEHLHSIAALESQLQAATEQVAGDVETMRTVVARYEQQLAARDEEIKALKEKYLQETEGGQSLAKQHHHAIHRMKNVGIARG